MPGPYLIDRQVVVASILRPVGQRRTVRADRASNPAMLAVAEIRTRLLGETYAPDDQLLGFGLR